MSLRLLRPGVAFAPHAADSFGRVERELGRELQTSRTTVPYEEQAELYRKRQRGEYPYSVADPDESEHVYRSDDDGGAALDTDEHTDSHVHAVLTDHGWIRDFLSLKPPEWWHYRHYPHRDNHRFDHLKELLMSQNVPGVIVHYESKTPRNGIHLAGAGFFHTFTAEEWEHFNWLKTKNGTPFLDGLETITPPTDRAFDVTRDFYLSLKS